MSTHHLIDHDIIAEADRHHAAQKDRLTAAAAQLAAAEAALEDASQLSADAVRGKATVSALDADEQHELAARRHRVAQRVRDAAQRDVTEAEAGRRVAEAKAWRGVYADGVRRRIAAAKAGEAARLALEAADAEHADATAALDAAYAHGTLRVESVHNRVRRLGSEEEERALWTSNGFDPVAGTYESQWT